MTSAHLDRVLSASAIVGFASISVYLIIYMPTFAVKHLGLPGYAGYLGGMISALVALFGAPYVGKLADRGGCVRVMTVTSAAALLLGWPLFKILVGNPNVLTLTLVQVILGILLAFYFGPLPALLAEMFPINIRSTAMIGVLQHRGNRVRRVRSADPHRADRLDRVAAGPELLLRAGRGSVPARADRGAYKAWAPVTAGPPSETGALKIDMQAPVVDSCLRSRVPARSPGLLAGNPPSAVGCPG